ncbi:MAG: FkbM family methyltransferase [Rhodovibrionaceae bacterium]
MAAPPPLIETGFVRVKQTRHGVMAYNKNDIYVGRALDLYGEHTELELQALGKLIPAGGTVIDVGANIGVHSVFFAKTVGPQGRVLAFEPQRHAFQLLAANAALNGLSNLRIERAAVGPCGGEIHVPDLDPAATSNFGGVSVNAKGDGEPVAMIALDSLDLGRCDLIKIDVEGLEIEVLQGARDTVVLHAPLLYVENDRQEHSAKLIALLFSLDYRLFWHLPYLFNPDNFFAKADNVFGNVLSVNMLAVPKTRALKIEGLKEILSPKDWWR